MAAPVLRKTVWETYFIPGVDVSKRFLKSTLRHFSWSVEFV